MRITHILLLAGTLIVVFGAVLIALFVVHPTILRQHLGQVDHEPPGLAPKQAFSDWLRKLGHLVRPPARTSLPKEDWEDSALKTRFVHAGWRSPETVPICFGIKTAPAGDIPLVLSLLLARQFDSDYETAYLAALLVGAFFGLYLPSVVLAMKIKHRKRDIFEVFPDSLDLIIVCVEAGLGLGSTVLRAVEDMCDARLAMAHEYELLTPELRAGLVREKALRNFAARTGVEDVSMLVAMLIQADRFGIGVAESLRVHSDMLRTKRQILAEEQAAKIGTKVLFPLIFCLFPAPYMVLLGPAGIQIMAGLRSTINNQRRPPQEIVMHPPNRPVIRHAPANYRPARPIRAYRMQGVAIVEFSLIFPTLLLTTFGVVEFGIVLYDKAVITNAAREAARCGAAFTFPARTSSQVQGVATSYCQNRLVMFDSAVNCTAASVIPCAGSGNPFTVTVSYSFTGLALAKVLAPFTGSISLDPQTTMLCE